MDEGVDEGIEDEQEVDEGHTSDDDSLLKQALPVPDAHLFNIKPGQPPRSAEEYLLSVRLEANQMDEISRISENDIDTSKWRKSQSQSRRHKDMRSASYFMEFFEERPVNDVLLPTDNWVLITASEFDSLREKVQGRIPSTHKETSLKVKDVDKILHYLENASNLENEDDENYRDPSFSSISSLSNSQRYDTLVALTNLCETSGFSERLFCWIYALLPFIPDPTPPCTVATLRELARSCARHRANLDVQDLESRALRGYNLIISVVSRCFNQADIS